MPYRDLTPEEAQKVIAQGGDPRTVKVDTDLEAQYKQQPSSTAGQAFTHGAEASAIPAAAGGIGAGLGMGALEGSVLGPVGTIAGGLIGAGLGSYGASKLQDSMMSDQFKQQLATEAQEHPYSAAAGNLATMPLGGFSFSPNTLSKAGGYALNRTLAAVRPELQDTMGAIGIAGQEGKQALYQTLAGAGLQAGVETGRELVNGEDISPTEIGENALIGGVFNRANMFGQAYNKLNRAVGLRPGFHIGTDGTIAGVAEPRSSETQVVPSTKDNVATGLIGGYNPDVTSSPTGVPLSEGSVLKKNVPYLQKDITYPQELQTMEGEGGPVLEHEQTPSTVEDPNSNAERLAAQNKKTATQSNDFVQNAFHAGETDTSQDILKFNKDEPVSLESTLTPAERENPSNRSDKPTAEYQQHADQNIAGYGAGLSEDPTMEHRGSYNPEKQDITINPAKEDVNTRTHELLHRIWQGLPEPIKQTYIKATSGSVKEWNDNRTKWNEQNPNSSKKMDVFDDPVKAAEEYFARDLSERFAQRATAKEGIGDYWKDFLAHLKASKEGASLSDVERSVLARIKGGDSPVKRAIQVGLNAQQAQSQEQQKEQGTDVYQKLKSEQPGLKQSVDEQTPFTTKSMNVVSDRKYSDKTGKVNGSQMLGALKNQVSPTEWSMLEDAGIRQAFEGKTISQEEAKKWVKENSPRVEIVKKGEGAASEAQRVGAEAQHKLETLGYIPQLNNTEGVARLIDNKGKSVLRIRKDNGQIINGDENHPALNDFRKWVDSSNKFENTDSAHYAFVAPKSEKNMPGYVEIAVVKPLAKKGDAAYDKAERDMTYDHNNPPGQQFPSSHHFPPNTLGFVRGYMEKDPVTGEKTFHVIEVQDDLVQSNHNGTYQVLGHPEFGTKLTRSQAEGFVAKLEPLYPQSQRLALKAAIDHARSEGATKIALSDAETAMMSEGHDLAAHSDLNNQQQRPDGSAYYPKVIDQEPGMSLHYDRTLPKTLEELTGSKGELKNYGEHVKAYEEGFRGGQNPNPHPMEVPRKDLIFKNPDGTPKTSVTARSYPLEKVNARRESEGPFTLFNKYSADETTPKRSLNPFEPELDKARRLAGASGSAGADALSRYLTVKREYQGKYEAPQMQAIAKLSPQERVKLGNVMAREDVTGQPVHRGVLNVKQTEAYNAIRQAIKQQQVDQIAAGQKVRDINGDGETFEREARVNPTYFPSRMKAEYLENLVEHKGNWKYVQNELLKHWTAQGAMPEQAAGRLKAFTEAMDTKNGSQNKFRGNRLAEGLGLPETLRDNNLERTLQGYNKRQAADRAWYDTVEKNPEAMKSLEENHHVFKGLLEQMQGEPFDKNEAGIKAYSRVATSSILGPLTNLHILGSSIVNPMQYLKASEIPSAYSTALKEWQKGKEHAIQNGYLTHDPTTWNDLVQAGQTHLERARALSSLIGKVNGRDWTDKLSKTFAQSLAEQIVPLRLADAAKGDAYATNLIKQLDPYYTKGKTYTPDEKAKLASTMAGFIHGAHDQRTLPGWMNRESIIKPFTSLMSWSVSQTNQWMKHVWEPATKGNIEPLLISTLGAAIGGYAIQQMRQAISDKKTAIPSLTEIANSSKGLEGNIPLLAYNFMQMASYTGFAGLGSTLAKDLFDMAYKNIPQGSSFPLDEVSGDVLSKTADAVSAWQQTPTSDAFLQIMPRLMMDILKDNNQSVRIASNWMADTGNNTEQANYQFGLSAKENALRRWKMTEGLPVDQQTEPNNNPYLNIPQKEFKRTQDLQQAAREVPGLIQQAQEKSGGDIDAFRNQLEGLKKNNYETMPSPESNPIMFNRYYQYLVRNIGEEKAKEFVRDYYMHTLTNQAKASMVPSLSLGSSR